MGADKSTLLGNELRNLHVNKCQKCYSESGRELWGLGREVDLLESIGLTGPPQADHHRSHQSKSFWSILIFVQFIFPPLPFFFLFLDTLIHAKETQVKKHGNYNR